jgi:endonuclease-3 related protein
MARLGEAIPLIASLGIEPTAPPFEVGSFAAVLAAFLTRAGDARAVASAITALRDSDWLEPATLAQVDPAEVEEAWRSAGARSLLKSARPLLRLSAWVAATFEVRDDGILDTNATTEALRDGLRSLNGIGPATADAILLDGLGRPAYPVDRATYRVLVRHGWLDPTADYDEARALIEAALPDDPAGLSRLGSGFEVLGRTTCRATVARCERCALQPLLPEGGPLEDS